MTEIETTLGSIEKMRMQAHLDHEMLQNLGQPKVRKQSVKKKTKLITVRLSEEMATAIEKLAFRFDKSEGNVAKILLDSILFQVAGEFDCLSPEYSELYQLYLLKEQALKQKEGV